MLICFHGLHVGYEFRSIEEYGTCEDKANHDNMQPSCSLVRFITRMINYKASEQLDRAEKQVNDKDEFNIFEDSENAYNDLSLSGVMR